MDNSQKLLAQDSDPDPDPTIGNMRQIWRFSLPMMLSSLGVLFSFLISRSFLAKFDINALNASVNAGTLSSAFIEGIGVIATMTELFVAQYYGAKKFDKIGNVVWQMIWVSIFSFFFFFLMGQFLSPLLFAHSPYRNLEIQYFSILMFFAPVYPLYIALAGFFIGRGKTKLILFVVIVSNLLNILVSYLLIFGVQGIFSPMGLKGAAIGSSVGYVLEAGILLVLFLKKKNRVLYNTTNWRIYPHLLKKSLTVGFPQGIFYALELIGWSLFFFMMTDLSLNHITISGICQTIMLFFGFFTDGISRGVSNVSGNYIGANKFSIIPNLLKTSLKLQLLLAVSISILLLLFPQFVSFLLPEGFSITKELKLSLLCVCIYLLCEGTRWIFSGLLVAAGDTWFLLISGSIAVWLFLLMPTYFIIYRFHLDVQYAWVVVVFYDAILAFLYYARYKTNRWQKLSLIDHG